MPTPSTLRNLSVEEEKKDDMNALLDRIEKQHAVEAKTPSVKFGAYVR